MQQTFNKFGQPELPYIVLCNPNRTELYSLGLAFDTKMTLRFNAISEFSFQYPKSIDGGVTELEAFSYLKNKRLVLVEGYGYFQIVNAELNTEGLVPVMSVECQSQQVELIQKKVVAYGGTKPLYNILTPENTVLDDMVSLAPNWSVGHVDVELLTLYRTFDISDSNVYNVLVEDVAKAFECIFVFDTVTRQISAYTVANATQVTDIFLSFDNVIKQANFSEKSDEIVTALTVLGDGDLGISLVNPLGTNKIYDFSYYKTTQWMSQGLVDAITAWENLVDSQQADYASNLLLLQTYNQELLALQSTLATLTEDYLALEGIQKVRIQANIPYEDINLQMDAKQDEIDAQNLLITNKNGQIASVTAVLSEINQSVSFANNFTPSQLLELDSFIYENTYRNENIIQTDIMTLVEIQAQSQQLYDQSQTVLAKVSQPRYEFEIESVNYTALSQFSIFTSQTEMGCIVTAELEDGNVIETVLLEMEFQFDNPSEFSATFSNRLRLDDGKFTYSDLVGEVVKTGSSVAFDSYKWSNWNEEYKDDVTNFISSALDAAVNNLVSNSDQEIIINQNGLRARNSDGSGGYADKQAWLVNNMLAFSDDGFRTAKLALGEINLPAGGTAYGLVADVVVGRMLAGTSLTIENEGNNFILDSNGATLNNAKFNLQTTNTRIIIDPTSTISFKIQKNEGGTFVNKFWVDNVGNVNFSGTLSGANGTFSGTITASVGNIGTLVIDSQGLKTPDGVNYIRGNGDLKWGGLSISGGSATFTGNIYADKLVGAVSYSQLTDIPVNKLLYGGGNGTLNGGAIYGGTMYPGSVNASSFSTFSGGIGTSLMSCSGNGSFGSLNVSGNISVSGGTGISTSRSIYTSGVYRTYTWSRGILVSVV